MTKKSGAQFTPRSRSSVGLGCRRPAIPREEDAMTGGAEAVLRDAAQRPRSPPGPASRPRTFLCLRPASPPSPWLFLRVFSPFFCFWGFFFPYYSFFFYLPFFYCSISAYSYSLPLTFAWPLLPLSGPSCVFSPFFCLCGLSFPYYFLFLCLFFIEPFLSPIRFLCLSPSLWLFFRAFSPFFCFCDLSFLSSLSSLALFCLFPFLCLFFSCFSVFISFSDAFPLSPYFCLLPFPSSGFSCLISLSYLSCVCFLPSCTLAVFSFSLSLLYCPMSIFSLALPLLSLGFSLYFSFFVFSLFL